MNNPFPSRPVSGFPVSIGTSIALETLFPPVQKPYDESRVVPTKPDIKSYTDILINTSTLVRNIYHAVPTNQHKHITNKLLLETLLEEILYIDTILKTNSLNPTFYKHTYAYPRKAHQDSLRQPSTDIQLKYFNHLDYCMKHVGKETPLTTYSKNITLPPTAEALLLTHVPWDLLCHTSVHRLELLESHSGVIKPVSKFNTKYFKIKDRDLSNLPFLEYLLITFGDNIMFKPKPLKERLELYASLVKLKVNPLSTETSLLLK